MPKKASTPEQIVPKLRQIEMLIGQGRTVPLACKEAGITTALHARTRLFVTSRRWRTPARTIGSSPRQYLSSTMALQHWTPTLMPGGEVS